jgi:hypothetical protein
MCDCTSSCRLTNLASCIGLRAALRCLLRALNDVGRTRHQNGSTTGICNCVGPSGTWNLCCYEMNASTRKLPDGVWTLSSQYPGSNFALWNSVRYEILYSWSILLPPTPSSKAVENIYRCSQISLLHGTDDSFFWLQSTCTYGPPGKEDRRRSLVNYKIEESKQEKSKKVIVLISPLYRFSRRQMIQTLPYLN